MVVTLERNAGDHAQKLVNQGKVAFDERDAWNERQPAAREENPFVDKHG
jgi:hypothetical protein